MIRFFAALLLASLFPLSHVRADDEMPKSLVIGYEEEGKVDASEEACRVFVAEVVEWEKPEEDQGVRDVCAARERHLDAYAAFQKAYQGLRAAIADDTRLNRAAAASNLAAMIKSCIEHKWGLTTGGHNIQLDIIPNTIDAECLELGRDLVLKETAALKGG